MDQHYFSQYKKQVEEKLQWGQSDDWRNQDFENLSQKIFDTTEVMLSSTTLKRIWGKLKYNSTPNSHTMDTLAAFLGYENWLAFKLEVDKINETKHSNISEVWKKKWLKWSVLSAVLTLLIIVILGFVLQENKHIFTTEELASVHFSSRPVTLGIPNTVVFSYDIGQLSPQKVEIQQSWDEKLRFEVDKNKKEATTTYYYPGYFRAKLLLNGQIAQSHDLYIKSDGWLAILHGHPMPRYFLQKEWMTGEQLAIKTKVVAATQADNEPPKIIGFHYVDDFGTLDSDHFTFESKFKNTYENGNNICQLTRVIILCTKGYFILPFTIPGCVGEHKLRLNELVIGGKDHDLSAFSCDYATWQTLKFESMDKKINIHLNDKLIFQGAYTENAGRVVGMRFLFTGNGIVKDIRLLNEEGELVFEHPVHPLGTFSKKR